MQAYILPPLFEPDPLVPVDPLPLVLPLEPFVLPLFAPDEVPLFMSEVPDEPDELLPLPFPPEDMPLFMSEVPDELLPLAPDELPLFMSEVPDEPLPLMPDEAPDELSLFMPDDAPDELSPLMPELPVAPLVPLAPAVPLFPLLPDTSEEPLLLMPAEPDPPLLPEDAPLLSVPVAPDDPVLLAPDVSLELEGELDDVLAELPVLPVDPLEPVLVPPVEVWAKAIPVPKAEINAAISIFFMGESPVTLIDYVQFRSAEKQPADRITEHQIQLEACVIKGSMLVPIKSRLRWLAFQIQKPVMAACKDEADFFQVRCSTARL